MKTFIGSYSLKRQQKAREPYVKEGKVVRRGWRDANVPEFLPNWMVTFTLPNSKPKAVTAEYFPLCSACMAVPADENPVKVRATCSCQKGVRKWAESWLETQTVLLQRGELQRLEEMRRKVVWSSPRAVLDVYLKRGPADAKARVNALALMLSQARGLSLDSFEWSDLTKKLKQDWAEMRQEAGRRGWLGLGAGKNAPAHAWEELRALKAAGDLPALDLRTVAEWNTTILGVFTNVNTIFGLDARDRILEGLAVPDLSGFLLAKFKLPRPKGHKQIPAGVMTEVERRLPGLLVCDARVYTFFRVCEETGVRPGTVRKLGADALKVLDDAGMLAARERMSREWRVAVDEIGVFGGLLSIPAAKGGHEVVTPISVETVRLLEGLRTAESLFGCKHKTAALDLHLALNEWLRECGVEGTHVAYLLRHRKAQALRRFGGVAAVSVGLGHVDEAMARRYSEEDRLVPALKS